MSLSVAKANLMDALKVLNQRWDRAKEQWDDPASRQFEKEFLSHLEARVRAAAKGLDHVAELMTAVKCDCGDERSE